MPIKWYKVVKRGKHSGITIAGTFESFQEAEKFAADHNIFPDAQFTAEIRNIREFTRSECNALRIDLEADLKRLGDEFNSLSGLEYIEIEGEYFNHKEVIGTEIYGLYAVMGTVMQREKELETNVN